MLSIPQMRDLLRRARDEEGLTLDELAAQTGVDRMVIHRVENTRKYPDYEPELSTVLKIIAGLRSPLSDIFVDGERLPALFNQHSKKDLPPGAVKPDNPGSPTKGTHGDQLPPADLGITDAITILGDELVNAINRLNTTFGSIDRQLVTLLDRLAADRQQGATGGAQPPRQRTRHADRNRKTG